MGTARLWLAGLLCAFAGCASSDDGLKQVDLRIRDRLSRHSVRDPNAWPTDRIYVDPAFRQTLSYIQRKQDSDFRAPYPIYALTCYWPTRPRTGVLGMHWIEYGEQSVGLFFQDEKGNVLTELPLPKDLISETKMLRTCALVFRDGSVKGEIEPKEFRRHKYQAVPEAFFSKGIRVGFTLEGGGRSQAIPVVWAEDIEKQAKAGEQNDK